MKRLLFSAFVLVALLAMTTGSALADGSVLGMSVTNGGGGPTFTFRVTGYLSPSQLNGGYVQVQGGDALPLYCTQVDETTVVCHASKKASGNVVVGFGGSTFWADMPEPQLGGGSAKQSCYEVYDWPIGEQPNLWTSQGQYCQDTPAKDGDKIYYNAAYWGGWWYTFSDDGIEWLQGQPNTNPGAAYYYR